MPTSVEIIDPDRIWGHIDGLSRLTESATPGWSRRVFTDPYRVAREDVADRMRAAGLDAHIDAAGNVIGVLAGTGAPGALVTGSHTDTVHGGGRFDGIVGVAAGIEVAQALRESGQRLRHDLVVVDFLGEEANSFGISCIGSRSIVGSLLPEHLDRTDEHGTTLGDTMRRFGLDPEGALHNAWRPGAIAGYVELHVEQGPVLEREGLPIGVVTGIAGIERLLAQFHGRPDHAGTRPMDDRQDALLAAAEAVLLVERTACDAPVMAVATSGRIEASPGSFNVVPDHARVWSEVRSVDASWLHGVRRDLADQIAAQAAARGVTTALEWLSDQDPVPAAAQMQDVIAAAADRAGVPWKAMPSGAGHDAAHIGQIAPMGMIFVPSKAGRSHVPEEWSESSEIALGAAVLLDTLIELDGRDQ